MTGSCARLQPPSQHEFDRLRQAKLVVFDTPDQPLVINSTWSNTEANEAVTGLFPDAFRFLFRKHSGEAQLWLGATVYKKTLTVASDSRPTGAELTRYCRVLGRSARDRVLYIVSKHKIASHHWDWTDPDSEDLGSDIDSVPSEDIVFTPPKPKPAYKGKGKAKEMATDVNTESETDSKALEGEAESDMRHAAKMRTRLTSGVIQRKTIFIPGSDDAEPEVVVVSDDEANKLRPLTAEDEEDLPLPLLPNNSFASQASIASSSSSTAFTATWTPAFAAPSTAPSIAPVPPMPLIPAAPTVTLPNTLPLLSASSDNSSFIALPAPKAPEASGHRFTKMGRGRGD
ncbi:hypothetical protein MSAN_02284600 [Mycena sanguinolenta]|uniref:Uncharacterized protein n=1 Tax=Mycena sanguinolenta TaxID=230812 RepID=A0A8H6X9M9_9AGAR|nr:hypothetical protein MSAN_02284600 [Mycena sanguinolenta]